jgi:predicted acyltransferase
MLVRIVEVAGTRIQTIRNQRGHFMRAHHVIVVAAVILVGFGVKLFFFSAPAVEAGILTGANASMNILQMHIDYPKMKNLPVLDIKDPI